MTNEVEVRSQRRRIVLMVMASAFLIWAGALVVLLATGRVAARSDSPAVMSALEDELVRSNRSKAFIVGYIVTLVTAGVVFAISLIKPLTGIDAAHLILVIAVITPMFAFVVLERINA